jgi:hypothetical protein
MSWEQRETNAFACAIAMGKLTMSDVKSGFWFFKGESYRGLAFVNRKGKRERWLFV